MHTALIIVACILALPVLAVAALVVCLLAAEARGENPFM